MDNVEAKKHIQDLVIPETLRPEIEAEVYFSISYIAVKRQCTVIWADREKPVAMYKKTSTMEHIYPILDHHILRSD